MKHPAKRLLALLLALSMSLSLLSAPVWAAESSGEAAESAPVTQSEPEESTPEPEEAPEESTPEPETIPENEPEPETLEQPDASPEAEPEPEAIPEDEPEPEKIPAEESTPEPEPEPEESAPELAPQNTASHKAKLTYRLFSSTPLVEDEYDTLEAAYQNVPDNTNYEVSPTITLLDDITLTQTFMVAKYFTLDLNGKSVTGSGVRAILVDNGGSLTLKGPGKVTATGGISRDSSVIHSAGTSPLTIESGVEVRSDKCPGLSAESEYCVQAYDTSKLTTAPGMGWNPIGYLVFGEAQLEAQGENPAQTYATLADAVQAAMARPGADTVTLLKDVDLTSTLEISGPTSEEDPPEVLTLNLNDHGIRFTGTNGSVIRTFNHTTLSITDSGDTPHSYTLSTDNFTKGLAKVDDSYDANHPSFTGGYITGGRELGGYHQGGGIYAATGSSLRLEGGTILGNRASMNGGGVAVYGGSFTMTGGSILGNVANDDTAISHSGGGVEVNGGSFTMEGGSITGNCSMAGGGVEVHGSFTMKGGSITGNCATSLFGGGVYISEGSFTMEGGSITGNCANTVGGGVAAGRDVTLSLRGGSITDNSAKTASGGVAANSTAIVELQGGIVVRDNVSGTEPVTDNLQLYQPVLLHITGPLTEAAQVGVTLDLYNHYPGGVFTADWSEQMGEADPAEYFTSDDPRYVVALNAEDTEAMLGLPITGIRAQGAGCVYDGQGHSIAVTETGENGTTGFPQGASVFYRTENGSWSPDNPALRDAGEHTVRYKVTAEGYAPLRGKALVSIQPLEVGLAWTFTTFIYNGQPRIPTATATGLVKGDSCAVTVTGGQTNAGEYTATATALSSGNYKLPQAVTQSFTIRKATQSPPAAPKVEKVKSNSVYLKPVQGQEYSINGGKTWRKSVKFTHLLPSSTYVFFARWVGDQNHFPSDPSQATEVMTKAERTPQPEKPVNRHLGVRVTQTGNKLTVKWDKRSDVDRFEVHAAYCGDHFGKIPTVKGKTKKSGKNTVTLTKLDGKALKTNRNFRVQVVGKKGEKVVCRSEICHVVGSRNRWRTNAKDLTGLPESVTLKLSGKKKTKQLKPKTVLRNPKRTQLGKEHTREFRYASSDKSVAKVSKKGKITAKGPGECTIYAIARNGLERKVKVSVKE